MKKINLVVLSFVLLMIILSSCASNSNGKDDFGESATHSSNISSDLQETEGNEKVPYLSMSADWPVYFSSEELIEQADIVFTGKVTEISFAVLDSTNGLPVTTSTEKHNRNLYTLYHVDVIDSYKGVSTKTLTFMVDGGLSNYNESTQMKLMKDNDARFADEGIPIWDGYDGYEVGKSYLFLLSAVENTYPVLINIEQSVYPLNELSIEDVTEMSRNNDISPLNLIKAFGDDKMSSFIDKVDKNIYE